MLLILQVSNIHLWCTFCRHFFLFLCVRWSNAISSSTEHRYCMLLYMQHRPQSIGKRKCISNFNCKTYLKSHFVSFFVVGWLVWLVWYRIHSTLLCARPSRDHLTNRTLYYFMFTKNKFVQFGKYFCFTFWEVHNLSSLRYYI